MDTPRHPGSVTAPPSTSGCTQCSADPRTFGHEITLGGHPDRQSSHCGCGFILPYLAAQGWLHVANFTFYFVRQLDIAQGMLLLVAYSSNDLRRSWAIPPISVKPCSKLALYLSRLATARGGDP